MGKLRIKLSIVFVLAALMLLLSSCGRKNESKNGIKLYVIDKSQSIINSVDYEPAGGSDYERALDTFKALMEYNDTSGISPFPENVEMLGKSINKSNLRIYFSDDYYRLSVYDEAIGRAAIVKTMCQFQTIDEVTFFVGGVELNIQGRAIGAMSSDSFLDDIMMTEGTTKVSLYFPVKGENKLRKIVREVEYNSAYTDEQLVIEELIAGPKNGESGIDASMPDNTRLVNVVTKDMICYVNLSQEFMNQRDGISEWQTLYSLVDSLLLVPGISSVMLTIDGQVIDHYGTIDTSGFLSFNYNIIIDEEE